jgi:hypothetical protein
MHAGLQLHSTLANALRVSCVQATSSACLSHPRTCSCPPLTLTSPWWQCCSIQRSCSLGRSAMCRSVTLFHVLVVCHVQCLVGMVSEPLALVVVQWQGLQDTKV